MPRLNITIPDELYARLERWRDRVNVSRICQDAISRELNKLEDLPTELTLMERALTRLGQQKARVDRVFFRKGVYDGLEWARQAEYSMLRRWGEQTADHEAVEGVLRGPAADKVSVYRNDSGWEASPYAEGWLAGVHQFWERAKKHL